MHSGWGLDNIDERVVALAPDIVFIEFSINDAVERFHLSHPPIYSQVLRIIRLMSRYCHLALLPPLLLGVHLENAATPELATVGIQIMVNSTGYPVRLTGVNISNIEWGRTSVS